jgi:hypothetical protein
VAEQVAMGVSLPLLMVRACLIPVRGLHACADAATAKLSAVKVALIILKDGIWIMGSRTCDVDELEVANMRHNFDDAERVKAKSRRQNVNIRDKRVTKW